MKLNQSYNEFAAYKYPEYEDFRRKILRQGTGFGLVTGGSFAPDVIEHYANRAHAIRGQSLVYSIAEGLAWLGRLPNAIRDGLGRARDRARTRTAILKLLRNPDYLLRDMGLERTDLEYLLDTGGSPETHFRKVRQPKSWPATGAQAAAAKSSTGPEGECANDSAVLNRAA